MAKRSGLIPKAPCGRILLNAGAKRVSQSAIDEFTDMIQDIAQDIATTATKIAKHSGRKTVQGADVKLAAKRGDIYDRNRNVLAKSLEADSVFAHPGEMKDEQGIAKKLSPILEVSYKFVIDKLTSDQPFVWLMRKISPAQAQEIEKLKLEGVGFIKESKRWQS